MVIKTFNDVLIEFRKVQTDLLNLRRDFTIASGNKTDIAISLEKRLTELEQKFSSVINNLKQSSGAGNFDSLFVNGSLTTKNVAPLSDYTYEMGNLGKRYAKMCTYELFLGNAALHPDPKLITGQYLRLDAGDQKVISALINLSDTINVINPTGVLGTAQGGTGTSATGFNGTIPATAVLTVVNGRIISFT